MTITASKPKMNSYLPYFGGKRTLASAIVAELGKHKAYACGATVLGAHSVGSPHKRQRLFWMADSQGKRYQRSAAIRRKTLRGIEYGGRLGDAVAAGLERYAGNGHDRNEPGRLEAQPAGPAPPTGTWDHFSTVNCIDGKTRRIESGSSPLADGIPARVVRLRGYGNAIVPPLAAKFIKACMESIL